jgi:hypothetical protein
VLAAAVTGCSTSSGSEDQSTSASGSSQSASATKKVAVTVKGDRVTPTAEPITISVGQTVELDVTSDRDGELHVHSSPEHELAFKPGRSTFRFRLDQPGSVIVEEHVSDSLVLKILVR